MLVYVKYVQHNLEPLLKISSRQLPDNFFFQKLSSATVLRFTVRTSMCFCTRRVSSMPGS